MDQTPDVAASGGRNGQPGPSDAGADQGSWDLLPPPAFPPGSRRIVSRTRRRAGATGDEPVEGDIPEDAFIDPDEPIVRMAPLSDDAFIDPDEPIVRMAPPRKPDDFEEVLGGGDDEIDPDDVLVTGIGDDPHLDDLKGARDYDDLYVAELVEKVGYLADQLREKGEAGLRTEEGMSKFEASLRAYCTGYLNARRARESSS